MWIESSMWVAKMLADGRGVGGNQCRGDVLQRLLNVCFYYSMVAERIEV